MKEFVLEREVWLPAPVDRVFRFFADAKNLQRITPPHLDFEILTPDPIEMRVGQLIDYRLKLYGLPFRWKTQITAWDPPRAFEDTQLRGPYRSWVHRHTFENVDGGTRCSDRVRYSVPGGAIVNGLFVRRDVERIFDHRQKVLREIFVS